MKALGFDPWIGSGHRAARPALLAGVVNALRDGRASACPPSSPRSACSTSRAASPPGSSRASSSPACPSSYNLIGRKLDRHPALFRHRADPTGSLGYDISAARQRADASSWRSSRSSPASCSATRLFGQMVYATGGNRRAADYAGINTGRVRVPQPRCSRRSAPRWRASSTSPTSAASTRRRAVARARRHRRGHHRRRLDLRRLRHDHRRARRRGGHHADPRAAVAADHHRRRLVRACRSTGSTSSSA